jgi:lipopolysaccharide transport system ATP-binding protein
MHAMTRNAIQVEGLGKMYRLGETHEHTLSDRIVRTFARLTGRRREAGIKPEDFWALRDVDLELKEGQALGIVGGNGAGKSTLLKVLSRITRPTTGRALVKGRLASLLEVGTGFHPELTGRENVYLNGAILGMRRYEIARRFDDIVGFSEIGKFIDTPVKRYSSGMYVRLAFAVAAHLEPDVLIVDEVLAVGDAEFQRRCLGKMSDVSRGGRTVLFVSHNMAAIQRLCTEAVWLDHGRVVARGEPSEVVRGYIESTTGDTLEKRSLPPGVLFLSAEESAPTTSLRAVRMLDSEGNPKTRLDVWDPVRFELEIEVARSYRSLALDILIGTPDGVTLIRTSTRPDQNIEFSPGIGRYRACCSFDSFPLSAGEYVLSVRLTVPGVEVVSRSDGIARIEVEERDVFGSGLPPASRRYLVATPNRWSAPQAIGLGAP